MAGGAGSYAPVPGHEYPAWLQYLRFLQVSAFPLFVALLSWTPAAHVASEADILRLPIESSLLGGEKAARHHRFRGHDSPMTQGERLESVRRTYFATKKAFAAAGLDLFLDAGTLLGQQRHDGRMIPWDTDADMAMVKEQCEQLFPETGQAEQKVRSLLEEEFDLLHLNCTPVTRGAGRIVDKSTGFFVDIWAYTDWETPAVHGETPWIHRLHWDEDWDRTPIRCPKSTLFPMQNVTFLGEPALAPASPVSYLQCQYGDDLGVPIWPFQVLLYTRASMFTILAVLAAIAACSMPDWIEASGVLLALVPVNGLRLLSFAFILLRVSFKAKHPLQLPILLVGWFFVLRDAHNIVWHFSQFD